MKKHNDKAVSILVGSTSGAAVFSLMFLASRFGYRIGWCDAMRINEGVDKAIHKAVSEDPRVGH